MDKGSFMFLLLFIGFAALATYSAFFPLPTAVVFTRFLGLAGFMVLCVTLSIGPLAALWPGIFAPLLVHRRALGISSFVIVLAHFLLAFILELNSSLTYLLSQLAFQIAAIALAILAVLAAISNDWSVKNIKSWKTVQRGAYIAFALAFVHFILKANGLFVSAGSKTFVNLGEVVMVAVGIATVALQLAGFYVIGRRKNAAQNQAQPPAEKTN